jgi:hypothetical protein
MNRQHAVSNPYEMKTDSSPVENAFHADVAQPTAKVPWRSFAFRIFLFLAVLGLVASLVAFLIGRRGAIASVKPAPPPTRVTVAAVV